MQEFLDQKPHLAIAMLVILGILVLAQLTVWLMGLLKPQVDLTQVRLRIKSWWVMATVFLLALALDRTISLVFMGFVSFLALKEYLSIVPTRRADRRVLLLAYASIPIQFYWIGVDWYGMFIIFVPVYMFLFLPIGMIVVGETKGFLRAAGTLHWGLMTTVFSISHLAYLLVLRPLPGFAAGGGGLVLFLVVLTQLNDVAQFIAGKSFGRHAITPSISPNKTVEGLLGGVLFTLVAAWFAAPILTPLQGSQVVAAALIISISGFIGDVTISAIKRDLQIKDSGSTIPGHGGVLDRVDSLTYTAPLFFHFIIYLHY